MRTERFNGSRVLAVVGPDGVGKSKVVAALLELGLGHNATDKGFAEKSRLLERESAEDRRNFSCYSHIYSQAAGHAASQSSRLHLVDTPGHVDRAPIVERALHMAHGAIAVISASKGVDAACCRAFAALERAAKPAVVFINGIDKVDDMAAFESAVDALEKRLGIRPVVLFAPAHFAGKQAGSSLLNVLEGSICTASDCSLIEENHSEIAGGKYLEWAKKLRSQQVESLASVDDEMMEAFVEFDGDVPRAMIEAALHRAVAAGKLMPLVAGSAKSGLGIDALQEVIHSFIPGNKSGTKILEEFGTQPKGGVKFSARVPFLGWAFAERTVNGDHMLEVRILDGTLKPNTQMKVLFGAPSAASEVAPTRMLGYGLQGRLDVLLSAGPGDVVLVPVPAEVRIQDRRGLILADRKLSFSSSSSEPAVGGDVAAGVVAAAPCVYALRMEALKPKEQEKLVSAIKVILRDEDGLCFEEDKRTGEKRLRFMGPLHMELVQERLAEEFHVLQLSLGPPRIGYFATPRASTTARAEHKSGGKTNIRKGIVHEKIGHTDAWAKVELAPGERNSGITVLEPAPCLLGRSAGVARGLANGLRAGLEMGTLGGLPVTDVTVRLKEAEVENEELAFLAAEAAVARALQLAATDVSVLEPYVQVQVDVPSAYLDGIVKDLEKRHGEIWGTQPSEGDAKLVLAEVPLKDMQNYAGDLQKLTDGNGFFTTTAQVYRELDNVRERQILQQQTAAVPH